MRSQWISRARRTFLKNFATLGGVTAAASLPPAVLGSQAQGRIPTDGYSLLPWYTRTQNYRSLKQSSFDRTGGNDDSWPIEPGKIREVFNQKGPGMITHIWFTIAAQSRDYLKELVFRAWWDEEENPSIESPVGDFFGLNLGQNFIYQSIFLNCSSIKALNCYLPMPFRKSARMTITNEGSRHVDAFYSNIDFQSLPSLPEDVLYLHAWYNQATPNPAGNNNWKENGDADALKNPDGRSNYLFAEARGRGHLMGVTLGIWQNQDYWAGEGDEMIFVDDETKPVIVGTGSEDYFCGAWNFGGTAGATPFAHLYNGAPYILAQERVGGRYVCYRWHADNPVTFSEYMKHTIEHGHANHRADNFFSCCYWYQTEPHLKFPAMAPLQKRIPAVYAVGPNGALKP